MSRLIRGLPKLLEARHRRFLRFYLMMYLGKMLVPGYRFKLPEMDWWHDDAFNAYLIRFGEQGWLNTERRWFLHQLLRQTHAIPGDTAECGVFRGASSYLICAANERSTLPRTHHVFDSFEGLSEPDVVDGLHWRSGDLAVSVEAVREALHDFPTVEYYKGWIPDRFSEVSDRSFSFVHIDVDLAQPTRESLSFFYPRMTEGGIILCDDYGGISCAGATAAVDAYLADKPEKMMSSISCGGYLVKGCETGAGLLPGTQSNTPGA